MTITHHPSDETLALFASGALDEARSVVVATHIALCDQCRRTLRAFEQVGGSLLDQASAAELRADALDAAMTRIETAARETPTPAAHRDGRNPALSPYDMGRWRWIGRGVQWRSVDVPSTTDGIRVFMLRANPGTRLPHHRHSGVEWTCVLQGAFRHELGRYGPGDFDEADESVEHRPFVEEGEPCICVVALQGQIELQSWLGRMVQPFIRV